MSSEYEILKTKYDALAAENERLFDRAITAEGSNETYIKNAEYDEWRIQKLTEQLDTERARAEALQVERDVMAETLNRYRRALEKLAVCGGGCEGPLGCMCKAPIAREALAEEREG